VDHPAAPELPRVQDHKGVEAPTQEVDLRVNPPLGPKVDPTPDPRVPRPRPLGPGRTVVAEVHRRPRARRPRVLTPVEVEVEAMGATRAASPRRRLLLGLAPECTTERVGRAATALAMPLHPPAPGLISSSLKISM